MSDCGICGEPKHSGTCLALVMRLLVKAREELANVSLTSNQNQDSVSLTSIGNEDIVSITEQQDTSVSLTVCSKCEQRKIYQRELMRSRRPRTGRA